MRPLELDFQPRRISLSGLALLLAGGVAMAAAVMDYRQVADEAGVWQAELASLDQPGRRRQTARGDERESQQLAQAAGQVAQDIRRPWDALFAALEEAKTDDIAILSLNPDAAKGVVRIAGEAKRRDAVLAYVERLGKSRALRNAYLVEDQVQEQDPEKPVRFLVSADWVSSS